MNIKHLCLIAGLLGLPVAYANATTEIIFNVPVELTNVPRDYASIVVKCTIGIGPPHTWHQDSTRYNAREAIPIPASRNISRVVHLRINLVTTETHYLCELDESLAGAGKVAGAIPLGVTQVTAPATR